jgi:hypothetical protein
MKLPYGTLKAQLDLSVTPAEFCFPNLTRLRTVIQESFADFEFRIADSMPKASQLVAGALIPRLRETPPETIKPPQRFTPNGVAALGAAYTSAAPRQRTAQPETAHRHADRGITKTAPVQQDHEKGIHKRSKPIGERSGKKHPKCARQRAEFSRE